MEPLENKLTHEDIWLKEDQSDNAKNMRQAVEKLVASFSRVPNRWVSTLLTAEDSSAAVPMWGTCYIVNDPPAIDRIEKLMIDRSEDPDYEEDIEGHGWQSVGETGVVARWVDDELVLGIDGAGYSFYHAHWQKLYDALELRWH